MQYLVQLIDFFGGWIFWGAMCASLLTIGRAGYIFIKHRYQNILTVGLLLLVGLGPFVIVAFDWWLVSEGVLSITENFQLELRKLLKLCIFIQPLCAFGLYSGNIPRWKMRPPSAR